MKLNSLFVFCILSVGSVNAACISSAPATAPEARFYSINSTVSDILPGLMWSRCSLGQEYVGERCTGVPLSHPDIGDALAAVADANARRWNGHSDWRLPSIKQLFSIVEHSCHSPSISNTVFPDTPSGPFLTNTPNNDFSDVLYVEFRFGTMRTELFNTDRFLRLVREN